MKKFSGLVMLLLLTLLVTLPIAANGPELFNYTIDDNSICMETKPIVKEEVAEIRFSEILAVCSVEHIKPLFVQTNAAEYLFVTSGNKVLWEGMSASADFM